MKTCFLCHRIDVPLRVVKTVPVKGHNVVIGYMTMYVCTQDEGCIARQRWNGTQDLVLPNGVT